MTHRVDETQPCARAASIDLAVVGGGAAGLAASIAAAERNPSARIILLDGAKALGAKMLVSGGGRCNVTHDVVTAADFFGNPHIIKNVLAACRVPATIEWFASMGVPLKREDTGKLFPVTDRARTVVDALLARCRALAITIQPDHRVVGLEHRADARGGFVLRHSRGRMEASLVVLATGGRSLPRTGSDGFGYHLVRALGHEVTPTVPALVPLRLEPAMFHQTVSGVSHSVELTTVVDGCAVDRRTGSLLWTHFGISGPVVMDASRVWTRAACDGRRVDLYGNLLPGRTPELARAWLKEEAVLHPRRSLVRTLAIVVPERVAEALCAWAGCEAEGAAGQVTREDRERIVQALTRFRFPVAGDRGWNYAEVTAGGVPLEQVNFRTMESKLVRGLYLVGELLDCDGRIGGFNFQWAWSTGYLAGRGAVADVAEPNC